MFQMPPLMLIPPPEPQRICRDCRVLVVHTFLRRADRTIYWTWVCPNCGKEDADPPFDGPVKRY